MKYILKKLIALIITLLFISLLSFTCFSVIPGDAATARLGVDATPEQIAELRQELGLDDPLWQRYGKWLGGVLQGDFGESYQYDGVSVQELLAQRLPTTLCLGALSLILILLFSFPLGMLSAYRRGGITDKSIELITQVMMAVPAFFLGMMLTYFFGIVLHLFQPGAFVAPNENFGQSIAYLLFPAISVALPKIAMTAKFLRSAILGELDKDYVRTAYSKGNRAGRVLRVHVLRNALMPVLTFLALVLADVLAGSIVAEQVFSVPGMGRLLITAISNRDYPVVQAMVMYLTLIVVTLHFIVDILYQWLDPRVRIGS